MEVNYSFKRCARLTDICRVCLLPFNNMKYLLNESDEVVELISMLESVLHLQFQKHDVLPAYICLACEYKLRSAYEFQQLCFKSHDTFKTILLHTDESAGLEESVYIPIEDYTEEIPMTYDDITEEYDIKDNLQQQFKEIVAHNDHDYMKVSIKMVSDRGALQTTESAERAFGSQNRDSLDDPMQLLKTNKKIQNTCSLEKTKITVNNAKVVTEPACHFDPVPLESVYLQATKDTCVSGNEITNNISDPLSIKYIEKQVERKGRIKKPVNVFKVKAKRTSYLKQIPIEKIGLNTSKNTKHVPPTDNVNSVNYPVQQSNKNKRVETRGTRGKNKKAMNIIKVKTKHLCSYERMPLGKVTVQTNKDGGENTISMPPPIKNKKQLETDISAKSKTRIDNSEVETKQAIAKVNEQSNKSTDSLSCPGSDAANIFVEPLPMSKKNKPVQTTGTSEESKKQTKFSKVKTEQACHSEQKESFRGNGDTVYEPDSETTDSSDDSMPLSKRKPPVQSKDSKKTRSMNASNTKTKQASQFQRFPVEKVNEAIKNLEKQFARDNRCVKCNFKASSPRALAVHISFLHKEIKERWCSQCNSEVDNLTSHLEKHRSETIECVFCKKLFRLRTYLITHLKCHSALKPYPCETCGKRFATVIHLKIHTKTHMKKLYQCHSCNKTFNTRPHFKRHLKSEHDVACDVENCMFYTTQPSTEAMICPLHVNDLPKINCTNDIDNDQKELREVQDNDKEKRVLQIFCETCNTNVRSLVIHNRECHGISTKSEDNSNPDGNLCVACGKIFSTLAKLKSHFRTHTREAAYQCSYCDKKMLRRSQLVAHERTHTGERPYVCKFCGKKFTQNSGLSTHLLLHTGRPLECRVCGQRFCRPGALRVHSFLHTGERPFLCTECGRSFVRRTGLQEHMRTHTGDCPYRCIHCQRTFRYTASLRAHSCEISEKDPYKCSKCPFTTSRSYTMDEHLLSHRGPKDLTRKPRFSGKLLRLTCFVCTKQFKNIAELTAHSAAEHNTVT